MPSVNILCLGLLPLQDDHLSTNDLHNVGSLHKYEKDCSVRGYSENMLETLTLAGQNEHDLLFARRTES